jgi:hypothetical protein
VLIIARCRAQAPSAACEKAREILKAKTKWLLVKVVESLRLNKEELCKLLLEKRVTTPKRSQNNAAMSSKGI